MAAPVLYKYVVTVTWTPEPGVYAPQSMDFVYHCADATVAATMARTQCSNLDAINPATYGTPFLDDNQVW